MASKRPRVCNMMCLGDAMPQGGLVAGLNVA